MRNTQTAPDAGAVRFGVSMEADLLRRFDRAIAAAGYGCRSEAFRDLARRHLADATLRSGDGAAVGVLSFVYDHARHDLAHRLVHLQHEHAPEIVSTLHVHLDPDNCLEVLVLRGAARRLEKLADRLIAQKGVSQGKLMLTPAPGSARRRNRKER